METKQMIEVMQAFENGKKIECSIVGEDEWHLVDCAPVWAWDRCVYRIAPEPKKEGRWERSEIRVDDGGDYVLSSKRSGWWRVASLQNIPGFGGIDYQSPFDPTVIVRSMVPIIFKSKEGRSYVTAGDYCEDEAMLFEPTDRPGIPVAAWFWKEE